jgi:predicted RND superfamily exporter protein
VPLSTPRNDERLRARSRIPRALAATGLAYPRSVIAFWLILGLIASIGVSKLKIETSTDSVLDRDSEAWDFYQESQALFGGDEVIAVLFEATDPFDRASLELVRELTADFQKLPGVRRIDSLATVPLIRLTEDGALRIDAGLASSLPASDEDLRSLVAQIESDPFARNHLVSEDGRYFAVNLVLEANSDEHYETLLAELHRQLEGRKAWVSGVPIFRFKTGEWTRQGLLTFVPLTILVVSIVMLSLLGSWKVVPIPLMSSGLGSGITLGLMGAVGVPLSLSAVILPSVLLALGCAYSMHFLTTAANDGSDADLEEAMLSVALPVSLSGLTTVIGFLALAMVGIPMVRTVGTFGAFGVLVVLAATLTFVPAGLKLISYRTPIKRVARIVPRAAADRIVGFVVRNRRQVMAAWLIALVVVGLGILRLRVETDVILWFPENDEIRSDYEVIRERLTGISPLNVVIEADSPASAVSPELLRATEELTRYLASLPEVGTVISIADPLQTMETLLSPSPEAGVPSDESRIEQYLLVLDSSEYIRDLLSLDRGTSNILLRSRSNGSDALLGISEKIDSWWQTHGPSNASARTTGIMYEFARAQTAIATGQIRGLIFVFTATGLILLGVFRWYSLALLALLPNAIPIAMAFGVMGLLGIPIDAGTVVVGCIAFGIAVDDTIHVVTEFEQQVALGSSNREAVMAAYRRVLPALVFTTVTVTLGFLVLGFSRFGLIQDLGFVTSFAMALCLLADVLLLPALLSSIRSSPST